MSVTQTVDIPASRRLVIDVPREVPLGRTILAFTPAPDQKFAAALSRNERATPLPDKLLQLLSQPTPLADALSGAAANLGDITLEQIREERLAKYLI